MPADMPRPARHAHGSKRATRPRSPGGNRCKSHSRRSPSRRPDRAAPGRASRRARALRPLWAECSLDLAHTLRSTRRGRARRATPKPRAERASRPTVQFASLCRSSCTSRLLTLRRATRPACDRPRAIKFRNLGKSRIATERGFERITGSRWYAREGGQLPAERRVFMASGACRETFTPDAGVMETAFGRRGQYVFTHGRSGERGAASRFTGPHLRTLAPTRSAPISRGIRGCHGEVQSPAA
jgi:hypothetical protein